MFSAQLVVEDIKPRMYCCPGLVPEGQTEWKERHKTTGESASVAKSRQPAAEHSLGLQEKKGKQCKDFQYKICQLVKIFYNMVRLNTRF